MDKLIKISISSGNVDYTVEIPENISLQELENVLSELGVSIPASISTAIENRDSAISRFNLSQIANKTPSEIYTIMQTAMDNWTSLADARADLREWLPLMAAIIAWKVI